MDDSPVNLTLQELEDSLGVLFIGFIGSMMAYGFTFFQSHVYFSRYPMDHWGIKATVATLCLLDTANSALLSHALYQYIVFLFPLTIGLVNATSTYRAEFGLSVLAVFITQIFYAYRLWHASKCVPVAAITAVISTAALAMGLAITAKISIDPAFASLGFSQTKTIMALSQGFTFLSALLTFIALCVYLRPSYHPSIKPLEGWYDTLVAYSISRGSLATAVQLCFFVSFVTAPTKALWMPFHLLASKFFINSLLTMLNSRDVHEGEGLYEEDTHTTTRVASPISGRILTSHSMRFGVQAESKPVISIEVPMPPEAESVHEIESPRTFKDGSRHEGDTPTHDHKWDLDRKEDPE